MITSEYNSAYNAINPNLFIDQATGGWWLTFGGSSDRIMQVELVAGGGGVKDGARPYAITGGRSAQEAPILIERNTDAGIRA
jgi:hypothetical protein